MIPSHRFPGSTVLLRGKMTPPSVTKMAGAMSPKIFGDRNFAFGYVPEIRDRRGLDMS